MTNSFFLKTLIFLLGAINSFAGVNDDKKRAEEIKQMMWKSGDKDFSVTTIPDKWKNQSAVIIAKSNILTYRKAVFVSALNHNQYNHYRVMILDKSALEEYSQFSLSGSKTGNGVSKYLSFAGFKIIKRDGGEKEISLDGLVKEEGKYNNSSVESYKLAIPNLETGDILDYYIAEEETFVIAAKYYAFDPVIFQLHDNYPVVKQKISFEVLRKCYINLVSLNGAPEFKLVKDTKEDKNYYSLEDGDRESIKNVQWLYAYRELPTIKFKIVYASSSVAGIMPGFIGDQGEIKSHVTKNELSAFLKYLFSYNSLDAMMLKSQMKKHFKKVTDQDKLARGAYYMWRYISRINQAETRLLNGDEENPGENTLQGVIGLSNYYKSKKIKHDIVVGIPRHISSIDDLVMENELTFMIRVNSKQPFYIGRFDNHSIVGEIDPDLQGQKIYFFDGLAGPLHWTFSEEVVPISSHEENVTATTCQLNITNLSEGEVNAQINKSVKGPSRVYYQTLLMDLYSYKDEEKDYGLKTSLTRKQEAKKASYRAEREENFEKILKKIVDNEYDIPVDTVTDLKVLQTGRFEDKPAFEFNYKVGIKNVVKRAGPNYIMDIGKFLESQVEIKEEEKERKYNVYMPFARSFKYQVALAIPDGYVVQGVEKLNVSVKNSAGGFTSSARVENGKLIIDTYKFYTSNYYDKEDWSKIVSFLEAAHDFTQAQILLKKI